MKANQTEHRVAILCRALGVFPSGYCARLTRSTSKRALEDAMLSERIRAVHIRSRGTYGLPRILVELVATGICVGCKRIA